MMNKNIPIPVKVTCAALLVLALIYLGQTFPNPFNVFPPSPLHLVNAAIVVGLGCGVLAGHRWAYVLLLVVLLVGGIQALMHPPSNRLVILFVLPVIPGLFCPGYFFKRKERL